MTLLLSISWSVCLIWGPLNTQSGLINILLLLYLTCAEEFFVGYKQKNLLAVCFLGLFN